MYDVEVKTNKINILNIIILISYIICMVVPAIYWTKSSINEPITNDDFGPICTIDNSLTGIKKEYSKFIINKIDSKTSTIVFDWSLFIFALGSLFYFSSCKYMYTCKSAKLIDKKREKDKEYLLLKDDNDHEYNYYTNENNELKNGEKYILLIQKISNRVAYIREYNEENDKRKTNGINMEVVYYLMGLVPGIYIFTAISMYLINCSSLEGLIKNFIGLILLIIVVLVTKKYYSK